jgi:hypothetical protein
MILGVSHESGHSPGFDAEAKLALFFAVPLTILGGEFDRVPDSRSGQIMGDLRSRRLS